MFLSILKGRWLDMRVLFLAQSPNRHNLHPEIAFQGTKSYSTLLNWLRVCKIDFLTCSFVNACLELDSKQPSEQDLKRLSALLEAKKFDRYVALGKVAAWTYRKLGITEFYEMPHPSGLNRQLNDLTFLRNKLKGLQDYVNTSI